MSTSYSEPFQCSPNRLWQSCIHLCTLFSLSDDVLICNFQDKILYIFIAFSFSDACTDHLNLLDLTALKIHCNEYELLHPHCQVLFALLFRGCKHFPRGLYSNTLICVLPFETERQREREREGWRENQVSHSCNMPEIFMILYFLILVKVRNGINGRGVRGVYDSELSEHWDRRFESRSRHG
jgi:hypothetical protein